MVTARGLLHRLRTVAWERYQYCLVRQKYHCEHFLLHCPAQQAVRWLMMNEVPDDEQNLAGLLAIHKNCKQLLNFVARTGRFCSLYGSIAELPDQE